MRRLDETLRAIVAADRPLRAADALCRHLSCDFAAAGEKL